MTVSLRPNNADMERIEDALDLDAYEKAMIEYKANPVAFSLEDVIQELDLQ